MSCFYIETPCRQIESKSIIPYLNWKSFFFIGIGTCKVLQCSHLHANSLIGKIKIFSIGTFAHGGHVKNICF